MNIEQLYELIIHWDECGGKRSRRELARRIRTAIEAVENVEPFAWCIETEDSADWCFAKTEEGVKNNAVFLDEYCTKTEPFPLYTHPAPAAQRQWVGLTEMDIFAFGLTVAKAKAVEALLQRRNT